MYATQAATGIKPGTLRVWLHCGKLTHHGDDTAHQPHSVEAFAIPTPGSA
nr:hypothetical protein OG781_42095 [Streptomyces sp. NBC_00830]